MNEGDQWRLERGRRGNFFTAFPFLLQLYTKSNHIEMTEMCHCNQESRRKGATGDLS